MLKVRIYYKEMHAPAQPESECEKMDHRSLNLLLAPIWVEEQVHMEWLFARPVLFQGTLCWTRKITMDCRLWKCHGHMSECGEEGESMAGLVTPFFSCLELASIRKPAVTCSQDCVNNKCVRAASKTNHVVQDELLLAIGQGHHACKKRLPSICCFLTMGWQIKGKVKQMQELDCSCTHQIWGEGGNLQQQQRIENGLRCSCVSTGTVWFPFSMHAAPTMLWKSRDEEAPTNFSNGLDSCFCLGSHSVPLIWEQDIVLSLTTDPFT